MGRKIVNARNFKKSRTSTPPPPHHHHHSSVKEEEEEEEEEEDQHKKIPSPNPKPTSSAPTRRRTRSRTSTPSPNPNPQPTSPTPTRKKSTGSKASSTSHPPNSPTMARKRKRSTLTSTPAPNPSPVSTSPTPTRKKSTRSKTSSPSHPPNSLTVARKRKRSGTQEEAPKSSTQTTTKGNLFERKWSYEDELLLLKAVASYNSSQNKFMSVTYSEVRDFLAAVLLSFSTEFTDTQVTDKLKRLRRWYNKSNTSSYKFDYRNPHKEAVFRVCHQIWGGGATPDAHADADADADDVQIISVSKKKKTRFRTSSQSQARSFPTVARKSKRFPTKEGGEEAPKSSAQTTKSQFERKWSYEDEVVLLEAVVAYNHSQDRCMSVTQPEVRDFLAAVSPSFSMEFSDTQVTDKLRYLHRWYNKSNTSSFYAPHKEASFRLCHQIWGGGATPDAHADVDEDNVQINYVSKKKNTEKKSEKKTREQHDPCYPHLLEALEKISQITTNEISKLVVHANAATFDNELREVDVAIMKHRRSKLDLVLKALHLLMEAVGI